MDALADQYEQNAKVALVLAKASFETDARKDWLNIAGEWVALAKARRKSIVGSREPSLQHRFKEGDVLGSAGADTRP